jgi:hypothetical protein
MATTIPARLQFDPDLPLFRMKVKGHAIEVFFTGHKGSKMWTAYVDADAYEFTSLFDALVQLEQIVEQRFSAKVEFYFPKEDK